MKIFCVGRNYVKHIQELNNEIPEEPAIFIKSANSVLKGSIFRLPSFSSEIHHEIELVYRFSKNIPVNYLNKETDYFDAITVGIDFTARDIQDKLKEKRLSWELSKSFDNSAVIGKLISFNHHDFKKNLSFRLEINGKTVQYGSSSLMIFNTDVIVKFINRFISIEKGDLLFTGTPEGVGKVNAGDILKGYLLDDKMFEIEIKA